MSMLETLDHYSIDRVPGGIVRHVVYSIFVQVDMRQIQLRKNASDSSFEDYFTRISVTEV
jgi:hypothetical protein